MLMVLVLLMGLLVNMYGQLFICAICVVHLFTCAVHLFICAVYLFISAVQVTVYSNIYEVTRRDFGHAPFSARARARAQKKDVYRNLMSHD